MVDNKKLWDSTLVEIELNVSKANFSTWFRNTFIFKQDQGVVHLSVPNTFVRDWLINKYHKSILKALRDVSPEVRNLEYIISRLEDKNKVGQENSNVKQIQMDQLGLNELYINRESNLNPKYTFESLVVGPFNEVAYAAAQAVVKTPGTNYNPLFIYGNTGLGKTHLIQAVGNYLKKQNESRKVFYITSENFAVDYINSVQNNRAQQFKEKYRKYDVLIMDDVQFFSNKEKTQEELFHLFNNFYENNKQIVFSSDKPPKFIPNLEERLRSRFEGGMIVDIARPDFESRLAILKTKVRNNNLPIASEVIEYLASVIQDSVRELEGALNSIICQTQVKNRALTVIEVKSLVKNSIKPQKTVSVKDVIEVISDFYNIEEKVLYEKTRRKEIVKPRQIIMYILREDFNTSYPYIGQKLGGRDHTTVIHAYEKIKRDIKKDNLLSLEIDQIRILLYNN
ncbi:MAG: chromosomal replication initiator protein DnaA [Patescibacteria group bacterium]|mgnify:CR=1 FL=1